MHTALWLERLRLNGLPDDPALAERLARYQELLLTWNERMDLIAPLPEADLIDRHGIDSLTLLREDALTAGVTSLIDIGTGAGFPGMALAIARPDWQVTLVDALAKRITFLTAVKDELGLANVTLLHARAEDIGHDAALRERFDLAVARAVAPLPVLAEYLLPMVRVGGKAVAWKGPAVAEEWDAGRRAAHLCGGQLLEAVPAPIESRDWQHTLVPMEKKRPCPKAYPRRAGLPVKKPLCLPETK